MGELKTLALPSVRYELLRTELERVGVRWHSAHHVAATNSLTGAVQTQIKSGVALSVATLLDLVVFPARPEQFRVEAEFPDPTLYGSAAYAKQRWLWDRSGSNAQLALEFAAGNVLRNAVREKRLPIREGQVLTLNRRELLKTFSSLAAAGLDPSQLSPQGDLPRAAAEAWRLIEESLPAFATARDVLWVDSIEVATGRSATGRRVADLLRNALLRGFGRSDARRVIVHHGFYFYTPPQWRLFQLLGALSEVDQVFVVHDDGRSPVFTTWRLFFQRPEWEMPPVQRVSMPVAPSPAASVYEGALTGMPVGVQDLDSHLRVLKFRNASEFVREWTTQRPTDNRPGAAVYGAASRSLSGLVRRLDRDQSSGRVDLSELPVGTFLLALHRCIDTHPGLPVKKRLTADRLLDMVTSGFLDLTMGSAANAAHALRSCIDFFDGCDEAHTWVTRAEALHRLILDEVATYGAREDGASRLGQAAAVLENPMRMLPWADLSAAAAALVLEAVKSVAKLLDELTEREQVEFADYLRFLRKHLRRGLSALPPEQAAEVQDKMRAFGALGDANVPADGVLEAVQIILGQAPTFTATGDLDDTRDPVRPLRSLDTLGFERSSTPLLLTHLSQSVFPSKIAYLGWPFTSADIGKPARELRATSLEIMRTRAEHSGQSDLYLLHLALDGAPVHGAEGIPEVTLSWIEELDGELHELSPLVRLITTLDHDPSLQRLLGGVSVRTWQSPGEVPPLRQSLQPAADSPAPGSLPAGVRKIDARIAAYAHACARRMALQWTLTDSPSYVGPHHQLMLYGNLLNWLLRKGVSEEAATRACDDLLRQFTPGERLGSRTRAVVTPPGQRGATMGFMYLLDSKGPYRKVLDALNKLYRGGTSEGPDVEVLLGGGHSFLPSGASTPEACSPCPVRGICSVAAPRR